MEKLIKATLQKLLGPYERYNIYQRIPSFAAPAVDVDVVQISADDCRNSRFPELRSLAAYDGKNAKGFGITLDGELVCACWYWYGERYMQERGFWPLNARDAKLVQITTAKPARGKNLAKKLIAASAQSMLSSDFERLFARVWVGHKDSERAFEAAGWGRVATTVTFRVPLLGRLVRLQWPVPHIF